MSFSGKTCIVTGAALGIGAACTRLLAERGIEKLILVDRESGSPGPLTTDCHVEWLVGDVADQGLWHELENSGAGSLDYALRDAGVSTGSHIVDLSFAD
ncbi:SDR family oxidoreductase [Aurantiacibacter spongiae]|uniref:hypothetical protein n=1 Tax=Aurantiacibacter spongiae TaxID=2488860 RepID=UPI001F21FBD4|nr:hypothetical protein [Aurantiacibacter spongiae]